MHRPFLSLVVCVTLGACSRSTPPAEVPAPSTQMAVMPIDSAPRMAMTDPGAARATEQEYRGAYTRGFEASWFAPCNAPMGDALWWVTLTEDARLQRDSMLKALTVAPTGALAVRWRGTVSMRMRAGHMGRGTRYLLVTEIVDVRPLPGEGACGAPLRTS